MTRETEIKQRDIESRWSEIPREKRARLMWRFGRILDALFARLGLICICTDCQRVMTLERYHDAHGCPSCNHDNVVSPYWC